MAWDEGKSEREREQGRQPVRHMVCSTDTRALSETQSLSKIIYLPLLNLDFFFLADELKTSFRAEALPSPLRPFFFFLRDVLGAMHTGVGLSRNLLRL